MFGMETLDVLIGIVTIYLAFAVACTAIVESISAWAKLRSKNLEKAMHEMLDGEFKDGERVASAFYRHPLIKTLSRGENGRPAYIPRDLVGRVLEAVVITKAGGAALEKAVEDLPDGTHIKDLLQHFIEEGKIAGQDFQQMVALHFDATMDRVSGWFKRQTHSVTLVVSAVLVFSVNVDTIAIATALASNPEARSRLVELSQERVQEAQQEAQLVKESGASPEVLEQAEEKTETANEALERAIQAFRASGMPLGWSDATFASPAAYVSKVFGLLISIFAISLGAPFWFQVLQKFNAVRTSLSEAQSKREKAKAESSS